MKGVRLFPPEQPALFRRTRWLGQPQMAIGPGTGHASARGALDEALLQQIGLDHILDRIAASAMAAASVSMPTGPPP